MTYGEMLAVLASARNSAVRLRALSMRVAGSERITQRLTAMYGTERVTGGKAYSDPVSDIAARMIEQYESEKRLMDETLTEVDKGRALIMLMPDAAARELLNDYYINAWSYGRIAHARGWRNKSTVYRKMRDALKTLSQMV